MISEYINHCVRLVKKYFVILIIAVSMISVYVALYDNVVKFPFILLTLLVAGYSIYNDKVWIFHTLSFLLFFTWMVGNECIVIYDRQFSIQLFQIFSVIISSCVFFNRRNDKCWKVYKLSFFIGDVVIAVSFFGLTFIRTVENGNILLSVTLPFLALYWSEFLSRSCVIITRKYISFRKFYLLENRYGVDVYFGLYVMLGILVVMNVALSIVYCPGIITRDCASIYRDAQHIRDSAYRTDIHSFAWTIIIAGIDAVFHNYFAITVMLAVSLAFAWFYYMKVLYDCGLSVKTIVAITVLWFCIPGNWYYLVCSWKDIPFSICMLIVSAVLCRILFSNKHNKITYIILTISSFGMAVFRSNGQVVLIGLTIIAAIAVIRKKKCFNSITLAFGIALVMLGLFKGPIFYALDVSKTPEGLYTLPYIDGIWENVHQEVELSEATINFIETEIMPLDEFKDAYESAYTNRYAFFYGYEGISLDKAKEAYSDCLRLHPFITISARIKRTYNFWGLMLDKEFPADRNYISEIPDMMDFSEEYQWKFKDKYKVIRENIANLTTAAHAYGFATMTFSRCGACIILWVLLLRICEKNRKRLLFLITPPALNTMVLLIGCCYADYRYAYPMFMMTVPLIGGMLVSQNCVLYDDNVEQLGNNIELRE